MVKKKKKIADFQKTKLKVGRKLLRGVNDTKTDFKSKKIIVKEFDSRTKDPIKTLATNPCLSSQTKSVCLNAIDNWINSLNINSKSGEVVNTVSKYINDCDKRVRNDCIKCLKHCITLLHNNSSESVAPVMPIVLTYINCGLTHIDANIGADCLKLLTHLIDFCGNSLFNQLMQTIITRIDRKSNIDSNVLEICYKLVSLMNRHSKQSTIVNTREPSVMKWSIDECYCDIDSLRSETPTPVVNLTFQTSSSVDMREEFFKALEVIVKNELKALFSRNGNHLSLSVNEAKKAINALKISLLMGLTSDAKQEKPMFSIDDINANKKSNRLKLQLISHLNNELNVSINRFFRKDIESSVK